MENNKEAGRKMMRWTMRSLCCVVGSGPHLRFLASVSVQTLFPPSILHCYTNIRLSPNGCSTKCQTSLYKPLSALPSNKETILSEEDEDMNEGTGWRLLAGNSGIISSCFVGLLTGLSVVLFNYLVSSNF